MKAFIKYINKSNYNYIILRVNTILQASLFLILAYLYSFLYSFQAVDGIYTTNLF